MNLRVTPRETQILDLYGLGFSQKEIADQLQISTGTVDKHIKNAKEKMGLNKAGEIALAVTYKKYRLPLTDLPEIVRKRIAAALLVLSIAGMLGHSDFLRVLRPVQTRPVRTTRAQRGRRSRRNEYDFYLEVA